MVRLGTKWPSITSTCSQSASGATSPTASARLPKSADSTEGAIRSIRAEPTGVARRPRAARPPPPVHRGATPSAAIGRLPGRLDPEELEHAVSRCDRRPVQRPRVSPARRPRPSRPAPSSRPRPRARAGARRATWSTPGRDARHARGRAAGRSQSSAELVRGDLLGVGRLARLRRARRRGRRPRPPRCPPAARHPMTASRPVSDRHVLARARSRTGAVASTGPVSSPASSRMSTDAGLGCRRPARPAPPAPRLASAAAARSARSPWAATSSTPLRDDAAVGHDHAQLGAGVGHVVELVGDRRARDRGRPA